MEWTGHKSIEVFYKLLTRKEPPNHHHHPLEPRTGQCSLETWLFSPSCVSFALCVYCSWPGPRDPVGWKLSSVVRVVQWRAWGEPGADCPPTGPRGLWPCSPLTLHQTQSKSQRNVDPSQAARYRCSHAAVQPATEHNTQGSAASGSKLLLDDWEGKISWC